MNNNDQKLVDRLNKRMSGADTSARDENNGFGMTYTWRKKNEKIFNFNSLCFVNHHFYWM